MNDYLSSFLLGIVEGLTEFIPVSSTAHLRITQALLHIDLSNGFWKMYSVVIQLGAVLALLVLYAHRLLLLAQTFPRRNFSLRTSMNHPLTLVGWAFLFTAIPAFLLSKVISKNLEDLTVIGSSLLIGGIVMWLVDRSARKAETESLQKMTAGQAIGIGLCQTVSAVFPGTSRSMTTIVAGQIVGLSREAAVEFSFLLFIPTMLAATLFELFQQMHSGAADFSLDGHYLAVLGIGFSVAALAAYLSCNWLLRWVGRHGFVVFGLYRICIGLAVLIWVMAHGQ